MLRLFSPAKLNLFFRVIRKREDGYHEIASLFQTVDLGDDLEISLNEVDELTCTDPQLTCGRDNLVLRAVDLFRKKSGLKDFHIRCHLTKRIPMQAGLGGGSSNAATTLFACNELAGRPASCQELASWAADIGSDISFFFSSGSAYCTGRGEIMQDVDYDWTREFPQPCYLAKPKFGLMTSEVYKACNPYELYQRDPLEVLHGFLKGNPEWFNDLEPGACQCSIEFQKFMATLRSSGFSHVVLTGSGSGAFCFGRDVPPPIDGVQFYSIHPLVRNAKGWYRDNIN